MRLLNTAKDFARSRVSMQTRRRIAESRVRVRANLATKRGHPNFLVLGAQRSGTSSLYRYLGSHPDLIPSIRKETQYFSTRFQEGEEWYLAHFPLRARISTQHKVTGVRPLSFEATPDYLFHPLAPERVRQVLPDARFIILLRDPVDRAFSHYKHMCNLGFETLDFRGAIAIEDERIQPDFEALRVDPFHSFRNALRFSYIKRGNYVEQLQRWLSLYDRDRFLILDFSEFVVAPRDCLTKINDFLKVRQRLPSSFPNYSLRAGRADPPDEEALPDDLRSRLASTFAAQNVKLHEITGRQFSWT